MGVCRSWRRRQFPRESRFERLNIEDNRKKEDEQGYRHVHHRNSVLRVHK